MTRIGHQNLNAAALTGTINSERIVEYLVVYNNNPVPVYVRLGSPEIPNQRNYDIAVPPSYIMAISVNSHQFGFRLGDLPLLTGLLTGNTVIEGMIDEAPPALGGVPIVAASLSTSDLTGGIIPGTGTFTTPAFDLLFWGGALVYCLPTPSSGQGVLTVQTSSDQLSWSIVARVAFWPDVPLILNVPRVARFMRLVFNSTAIPGEPAIAYSYAVRAMLQEVPNVEYIAGSAQITKSYNVPNLTSVDYYFCTVGLKSVSARLNNTSGNQAELTFYTSNVVGNWALAFFREQLVSSTNSIYRSVGSIDSFLRINVSEIGNNGPIVGTLNLTIQSEPDETAALNSILAALGDIGAPSNVNQDIFHVLDNSRLALNNINTNTANTATRLGVGDVNAFLSAFQTDRRAYTEFFFYPTTVVTGGVSVSANVLNPYANRYIAAAMLGIRIKGRRAAAGVILVGIGTAGGVNEYLYRIREDLLMPSGNTPIFKYDAGPLSAGKQMTPGRDYLWFYADSDNVEIDIMMAIR